MKIQADALKAKRDSFNSEAKKWADKRDAINLRNSDNWNAIKEHRDKRDEINESVAKLKSQRTEIAEQLKKKREEYLALRERVDKLLGRATSHNPTSVKRQIDKLDWEIQTNSLTQAEEKRFS